MRLKQSDLEVMGGCLGDRISSGWFRAFVSVQMHRLSLLGKFLYLLRPKASHVT
jgi:hypothetical protein